MGYLNSALYFEVQIKAGKRADHAGSLRPAVNPPCFILNFDNDWNDYGYSDWFALFYADSNGQVQLIGELKLMSSRNEDTFSLIKDGFTNLDDTFCSVGKSITYYENLHNLFGKEGSTSILHSLKDCAVNVEVREKFKDNDEYHIALERDIDTEQMFRLARFVINGQSIEHAFSFEYVYHPIYSSEGQMIDWRVDFKHKSAPFERYVGLIGENGVGKTQLLKSLISSLVSKRKVGKIIKMPTYSCLFTICSTPYDGYDKIKGDNYSMPYFYSSSEQSRDTTAITIEKDIRAIFNRGMIGSQSATEIYIKTLNEIIPGLNTKELIQRTDSPLGPPSYTCNDAYLNNAINKQSSGERHLFLLISKLFAKIYYNTLFVLDEPEVHLHPKAIIEFMSMLSKILQVFDSFCVIATHSPLIIREMVSHNVYLITRNDNIMNIGSLPGPTFGEDISKLYTDIFGYNEKLSLFTRTVQKLIDQGFDFDQIVNELNRLEPLSLNTIMAINTMTTSNRKSNAQS